MSSFSDAQSLSERVHTRFRRNALRAIVKAEAHLDAAFRDLAEVLREELAVAGLSEDQILDAMMRAFARMSPERLRRIEAAIGEAARAGVRAAPELHRRIFGANADAPAAERPFVQASGSSPMQKPSLQLLPGSGGSSPATD